SEAIGEICGWLFGADGKERHTTYRSPGLGYHGLRRIAADRDPVRNRRAILLCGGDVWRFNPLRAALKAGLCSVLATDSITARVLLGDIEPPSPTQE
ncbi:MAG TPA: sugar-binding domain-containing protein, partial [Candidatus Acidoferrales bacterium]|nr:sugar-binding domain-containing protein [Candidatus Acidoferrales bacterium]